MAAIHYSQVNQARELWEGSHSNNPIPVNPPTTQRPTVARSKPARLQHVPPAGMAKKPSKENLKEPSPMLSGRRRSVSFDNASFPSILQSGRAPSSSPTFSNASKDSIQSHANYQRRVPSSRFGSIEESNHWSNVDHPSRQRSSTMILPSINRQGNMVGDSRGYRHPAGAVYNRSLYHQYQHSSHGLQSSGASYSSLTSRGSALSLYGRKGKNRQRKVKYENTYRMEPAQNFHSVEGKIRRMMESCLESNLRSLAEESHQSTYAQDAADASKILSETVKQHIKFLNLQRYKIVCLAAVYRQSSHDMVSGSQCLWNTETDGFVSVKKQVKQWLGEVTVYAVYQE